jgi:hypothetical protein
MARSSGKGRDAVMGGAEGVMIEELKEDLRIVEQKLDELRGYL